MTPIVHLNLNLTSLTRSKSNRPEHQHYPHTTIARHFFEVEKGAGCFCFRVYRARVSLGFGLGFVRPSKYFILRAFFNKKPIFKANHLPIIQTFPPISPHNRNRDFEMRNLGTEILVGYWFARGRKRVDVEPLGVQSRAFAGPPPHLSRPSRALHGARGWGLSHGRGTPFPEGWGGGL